MTKGTVTYIGDPHIPNKAQSFEKQTAKLSLESFENVNNANHARKLGYKIIKVIIIIIS